MQSVSASWKCQAGVLGGLHRHLSREDQQDAVARPLLWEVRHGPWETAGGGAGDAA